MTTLEIETSNINVIDEIKKLIKNKFNLETREVEKSSLDEKYYVGYEKDRKRLHKSYNEIKSGKAKLYNEKEFKEEMEKFIINLKEKYENN